VATWEFIHQERRRALLVRDAFQYEQERQGNHLCDRGGTDCAYDYYLSTVRPTLMVGKMHSYVFCKQTGEPPGDTFDFSDWARSVCKELIGRPVNCHAFRSALVTSYYQAGATQSQMNALADVMAHDPATARNYYHKVDAQKQALEVHERMSMAYNQLEARGAVAQTATSHAVAHDHDQSDHESSKPVATNNDEPMNFVNEAKADHPLQSQRVPHLVQLVCHDQADLP
jgi:hypothetical protein